LPRSWRGVYAFTHRRSLAHADKIVAFHPRAVDRLRALGVAEERLSLLPPPATAWSSVPSRQEARERLDLPRDARIALCVSRFSVSRGDGRGSAKTEMIVDLVAAFAPLPASVMLVVVGDGPGRARIEEEVAARHLSDRVRLVGAVENKDVVWFYAACDFFAYPHPRDNCWISVLEAQACGRPVVVMRTRSAEITVADGETGLLARDLQEFQAHFEALALDERRCELMGRAARDYIRRHHSVELRVQQIEEMIRAAS